MLLFSIFFNVLLFAVIISIRNDAKMRNIIAMEKMLNDNIDACDEMVYLVGTVCMIVQANSLVIDKIVKTASYHSGLYIDWYHKDGLTYIKTTGDVEAARDAINASIPVQVSANAS